MFQKKLGFLCGFSIVIFVCTFIKAQDSLTVYNLGQDIIVTANRVPTAFSDVARTITVIGSKEIEQTAAQSVPELLENISGVDVLQRGTQGVQADISIRGAGFNQRLILVDGIKMSDPQTGHHNMNLPVDLSDIERIEIVKGPGSRLYGPNAFGGIINILTKDKNDLAVTVGSSYGEHNLYNSYLNFSLPLGETRHNFTASKSGSDGYRYNTDFNQYTFSQKSIFSLGAVRLNLSSGINDKKFGANNFYVPQLNNPDQYEETRLTYIQAGAEYKKGNFAFSPQAYLRKHEDTYFWKKNISMPAQHKTYVSGIEANGSYNSFLGITSFGAEFVKEEIESNSLGNHQRQHGGLFVQQQFELNHFLISTGASLYYYSNQGWQGWPGMDISYRPTDNSKIFASYAEGFREPTYTNLYLNFPAKGNPNLKNEKSRSIEVGYSRHDGYFKTDISLFDRNDRDLIDYVKFATDTIFHAENFTKINTKGLELGLSLQNPGLGFQSISAQYAYLNSAINLSGQESLYVLTHFRHQFILGARYKIPLWGGIIQRWKIRYEDRLTGQQQTLVDTRLSWKNKKLSLFVDVTNVLDENYDDIPGVPMPGRWLKLGFEYRVLGE